jgi:hypothetical protein
MEKVDMRHKRLLVNETAILAIESVVKDLQLDLHRHDIGRDIAPDVVRKESQLNSLNMVLNQWNT